MVFAYQASHVLVANAIFDDDALFYSMFFCVIFS